MTHEDIAALLEVCGLLLVGGLLGMAMRWPRRRWGKGKPTPARTTATERERVVMDRLNLADRRLGAVTHALDVIAARLAKLETYATTLSGQQAELARGLAECARLGAGVEQRVTALEEAQRRRLN